ncbi:DUF1289 domain-containing protein [Halopseudomonas phragmitis]|uniref:DUF1289 domain-containing protein n=1 Tax=Halopseudomonas phragmitis TaxID=1931241 RepID=A0A1V0B6W8_9GAMM|nr:DUF1289 domain-containing protein [Halopseudomonas phragmitis]AQZ95683.1 hypothetical protein BVH74_13400 [Halopseudomonas phragmitis]
MVASYTDKTPCVGRCSTVFGDTVCRGCKRFSHEIIDWNRYSAEQRAAIWRRLEQLLGQVLTARLALDSVLALEQALERWRVACDPGQPWTSKAYQLLVRAGDEALSGCGLKVLPSRLGLSARQLRDEIDHDFQALSQAYYERHTILPGMPGAPLGGQ